MRPGKSADVVIVGCGPVGSTLANLLGRRGVSVIVLEKQKRPYGLPRAIHFDGEAMRVFQAAGLAEQVLPSTMVGKGMLFKDRDDRILIDWSRDQQIGPMGWYESYRVHLPGLEQALLEGFARFDHVELVNGCEVVEFGQTSKGVELMTADGQQFECKYCVACDGAASSLREQMEIATDSLGYEERWLVVDLTLKVPRDDLGDYSVQFCDAENPATYVRGVGDRRRWEMRLKPDDPENLSDGEVWEKLKRWIGPKEGELERSAIYTFRSAVAEHWRQKRIFLAGDAAHQMPPFMGQGMCAGIRDCSNLAWKLDHVLKGADPEILDSYQTEREANVRQFIELSVRLGKLINQSARGEAPSGQMKSIWPCLGSGLCVSDGVGGELAPQVKSAKGELADDSAKGGFYVLAKSAISSNLPVFAGSWDKLDEFGFDAAIIRPDGYALRGVKGNHLDWAGI